MKPRQLLLRAACLLMPLAAAMPVTTSADELTDRFAALEAIWSSSVSPDGKYVALGCSSPKGLRAACVYELDAIGKKPIIYSNPPEQRLVRLFWAGPEWLLLHVNRNANVTAYSDNLKFIRIDRMLANNVRTGEISSLLEHETRQLDLTDVAATPSEWPGEILMRAGAGYGVGAYRVNLSTGRGKVLETYSPLTLAVLYDTHGNPVFEQRYDRKEQRITLTRRKDGVTLPLESVSEDEETSIDELRTRWVGFTDGGNKIAGTAYADNGAFQPYLFDVTSRKRVAADAALQDLNIDGWIGDRASDAVVGVSYTSDVPKQRFFDETLEKARLAVSKALPDQHVLLISWNDERSFITLMAARPGAPYTHYLFDRKQGSLSPLGSSHPLLEGLPPVTTTRIDYAARDGLKIEAFLTFPAGKTAADGPFPLILMPHGGPLARDDASFDWYVHYFAQRGYAILQPNFRGSDGYGLEFRRKGYGEFGRAMIDDIIDGARFVIGSGIADRQRVCSMGISYGGYAALMVPLRDPKLVKCAISVAGVTDPTTMLGERSKLYGRDSDVMRFWESYMGNRFRDKEEVAAASPVRSASKMPVPVLLIHGEADLTVPFGQSRHMQKQLALYGRAVRLVEVDTDHYFESSAARRVLLGESDAFLAQHLAK